ncbi:MAG: hypothetical protein RJQ00_07195 [Vicingaceae bacterium]
MKTYLRILFWFVAFIIVGSFFVFLLDGVKSTFNNHPIISILACTIILSYFFRDSLASKFGLEFISFTRSPIKFITYKVKDQSERYQSFRKLFNPRLGSQYEDNEFELSLYKSNNHESLEFHFDFYSMDSSNESQFMGIERREEDIVGYNGDRLACIKIKLEGSQIVYLANSLLTKYLFDSKYDIDESNYKCHLISKNEVLILLFKKNDNQTLLVYCTKHFFNLYKANCLT